MTVYPSEIPLGAQAHLEAAMPRPYDFSDPRANATRERVRTEMEAAWKGRPEPHMGCGCSGQSCHRPTPKEAARLFPDAMASCEHGGLIAALETFVLVTQEYGMSGKQWKALRLVQEARCQ